MKRSLSALICLIVFLQSLCALGTPADLEHILKGVTTIAAPGSPGTVAAFGPDAFVVADGGGSGKLRQPVIAAGRLGKGRVVVFGHDGYFDPANWSAGETATLMVNLVNWAAGGAAAKPIAIQRNTALLDALKAKKINAIPLERDNWTNDLSKFSAVFVSPRNDAEVAALKTYVQSGGGVLMGYTGWGWLQLNPGKSLKGDMVANKLAGAAGLAWTSGFASRDKGTSGFRISNPPPALHAGLALDLLLSGKADDPAALAQAGATIMEAARIAPDNSAFQQRLQKLSHENAATVLPRPDQPLRAKDALPRLLLSLQLQDQQDLSAEQVRAHPAAAFFPGAVPATAERINKTIAIDTRIPRWHSTGLYAPPGEIITVTLPPDAITQRLRIRIGAHTDRTYHLAAWARAPEISRDWPLNKASVKVASAFGGLIYIEVPDNAAPATLNLTIAGGVQAPYFVLGVTSLDEWRQTLRSSPAPWAELETDKFILTLKSDAIRQLDDPTPVLEHWRKVLDADATLAGWPIQRKSPERIVNDADISAGYMHSGYPIMTGLDVTNNMVDLVALKTVNKGWGFYHELGHNHQSGDWTFDGTTEVTVNLFTMYTLEHVCGATVEEATSRALKQPAARIKTYLAKPDFEQWKSDPFLALAMYAQLRIAFGWETYEKVFAEYRALPPDQRPRTDDQKRDQWLIRFSKATGRNLGPFFQAWGVPTSDRARAAVAPLPVWMPDNMAKP